MTYAKSVSLRPKFKRVEVSLGNRVLRVLQKFFSLIFMQGTSQFKNLNFFKGPHGLVASHMPPAPGTSKFRAPEEAFSQESLLRETLETLS